MKTLVALAVVTGLATSPAGPINDLGAGTLGSWNIVINNVPGPGALALLTMIGLSTRRRRCAATI